ncbi:MAG: hypothetical protein ABIW19_00910 [Vicinamibacterales bacterium]
MKQLPEDLVARANAVEPTARPDGDRRRFLVAGLAAAPVLVTLSARSASARQANGSLGNYGSAPATP